MEKLLSWKKLLKFLLMATALMAAGKYLSGWVNDHTGVSATAFLCAYMIYLVLAVVKQERQLKQLDVEQERKRTSYYHDLAMQLGEKLKKANHLQFETAGEVQKWKAYGRKLLEEQGVLTEHKALLQKQFTELSSCWEETDALNNKLEQAMKLLKAENGKLQQRNNELRGCCTKLIGKLRQEKHKLEEAEKKVSFWAKSCGAATDHVEVMEATVEDLKQQITSLGRSKGGLARQYQEKIAMLEARLAELEPQPDAA